MIEEKSMPSSTLPARVAGCQGALRAVLVIGYLLLVYWLSVIGYRLSVIGLLRGFKVQGAGALFEIRDSRFEIQDSRFKIQDSRFEIRDSRFQGSRGSEKAPNAAGGYFWTPETLPFLTPDTSPGA
jgi:hypothetical protein